MDRIIIAIVAFYLGMKYANMPAAQQQSITGELIPSFPGSPFESAVPTAANPSGQMPVSAPYAATLSTEAQNLLHPGVSGFGYMRNYIPGSGMRYGNRAPSNPVGYDRSFTVQNYTNADAPGGRHMFNYSGN